MLAITIILFILQFFTSVLCRGFEGKFVGVPQDAIEAQSGNIGSPIVNGLNYQARTSVKIIDLDASNELKIRKYPVAEDFTFKVEDLSEGAYELLVSSYDFNLRNTRFRVIVDEDQIHVYDDYLASEGLNTTSVRTVSDKEPLILNVVDYKQYYESAQGKLSTMVMESPFGVIFKNKMYTAFFAVALFTLIVPTILSYVAPDMVDRINEMKNEGYEMTAHREEAERLEANTAQAQIASNVATSKTTGRASQQGRKRK